MGLEIRAEEIHSLGDERLQPVEDLRLFEDEFAAFAPVVRSAQVFDTLQLEKLVGNPATINAIRSGCGQGEKVYFWALLSHLLLEKKLSSAESKIPGTTALISAVVRKIEAKPEGETESRAFMVQFSRKEL